MTSTKPPLLGIRHVAINTNALEATRDFWVGVMGYAVEWMPDEDNVYLCGAHDNLALHRVSSGAVAGRLDHIGLAVPAAPDVDAWAAHLQAHGVTLEKQPRTHRDGARSLYFRDPGGTLVQIIHHPPIAG